MSSHGGSENRCQPECEGYIPGAWPEWISKEEDEEQEAKLRNAKQQKVVQMIGQPAAGRTKTESFLGSGRRSGRRSFINVYGREVGGYC